MMRSCVDLSWLLSLVWLVGCGDNLADPCECTADNPALKVVIDWSDENCVGADLQFGIRSDTSILSFASARCTEFDAEGRGLSATFHWPDEFFDGDVVPMRFTTSDPSFISHGSDSLIARPDDCVVKTLVPACTSEPVSLGTPD